MWVFYWVPSPFAWARWVRKELVLYYPNCTTIFHMNGSRSMNIDITFMKSPETYLFRLLFETYQKTKKKKQCSNFTSLENDKFKMHLLDLRNIPR